MGEPQPSDGRAQLVAIDHGNDHATVESPWGRLADCRGRLAVHNAIVFAGAFDTLADLQAERAKTAALEEQVAALRPTSGEPTCPLCSLPLRVDWRGITASVLCTPECGYNDRIALQTPQSREAERLLQESFGDHVAGRS